MKRASRIVLLIIVFIAAVLFFFFLINRGQKSEEMMDEQAELPVVYMQQDGALINELHGYTAQMSSVSMRDSILPMPADDVLHLHIDTDTGVESVSYEITTLDGASEVAKGEGELTETDGGYEAAIALTDNLAQGTDHILTLTLGADGKEICYYSRLASFSEAHVPECMAFVQELHAITRDATRSNELIGRMEPAADGKEGGLSRVTIHSSLEQICWADFSCEELTEPVISIKEITNSYSVYLLEYPVVHAADGTDEYYSVRECYRVRYAQGQLYLLDFERTISRIFNGDVVPGENRINLGIRTADVDFASNQTGTVTCFVQNGDLWSCDLSDGEMVRVFSFRDAEVPDADSMTDAQKNYGEHEIRTVRVDENGSIDFIVYGYMNSGWHAGEVGISVCHYDRVDDVVRELLFLPQRVSYQQLKENVGSLMYLSDAGMFYFSAGSGVYRVDLATGEYRVLFDDVRRNFRISDDGRYLVWTDLAAGSSADVMHVTDLETEQTTDIPAGEACYIQPVGFLGRDLIYGIAESEDVRKGARQNLFPMRTVSIVDASDPGTILKTYDAQGEYFSSVRISSEGSVTLDRIHDKGNAYVAAEPVSIKNNDLLKEGRVGIIYLDSVDKQTEIGLSLQGTIAESVQEVYPRLSASENEVVVTLPSDVFASSYYVYAKGEVIRGTSNAAEAVRLADENGGVVTDASQRYIWNRAKMLAQNKIEIQPAGGSSDTAKALNIMLAAMGASARDTDALLASGQEPYDILKEAEGDGLLLNLSGCSLDEILYYIGRGFPAYAIGENGMPVLLYGYDSTSVRYYRPADGESVSLSLETATDLFAAEGNQFYVYQKQI